jgi:hypothetical protein
LPCNHSARMIDITAIRERYAALSQHPDERAKRIFCDDGSQGLHQQRLREPRQNRRMRPPNRRHHRDRYFGVLRL